MNRSALRGPAFVRALRRIEGRVEGVDPRGDHWTLRLSVSASLYAGYDALRCQEAPFDRRAFARRLALIERLVQCTRPLIGRARTKYQGRSAPSETLVTELYSRCWNHYDDQQFLETMDLFAERFELNGVGLDFLRGASCLDAGCGSGRYTFAMARLGAKRSVGIDLSERAIREAMARRRRLGLSGAVKFYCGSVLEMPSAWTDSFDFVCSNGVAHHTTNPRKALQEIIRVLKPGGQAFIFVYGAGGVFWALVDVIRRIVAPIPMEFADLWLQSLGWAPGKIFNAMDHWYTPIQERVGQREFEDRLRAAGFERLSYLPRAKIYDASERRWRFQDETDLVGEGDLRYLVSKPAVASQAVQEGIPGCVSASST